MAGTSGAVGSGAFTSAEAKRSVSVAVASDTESFLELGPCEGSSNGEYVRTENGVLSLDLSAENPTLGGGTGVNRNATTVLDDVFEIRNAGTQSVGVWVTVDAAVAATGDPAIEFFRGGDPSRGIVGRDEAVCLDVGESTRVGFVVRTHGVSDGDDLFATRPGGDGEALVINADAEVTC